ncbi:hypothetical protein HK102_000160 [Quaeritorhiza haematococci]|nr:hypothetical protein HK102_000160 [Quaeritorhiza haematococci]
MRTVIDTLLRFAQEDKKKFESFRYPNPNVVEAIKKSVEQARHECERKSSEFKEVLTQSAQIFVHGLEKPTRRNDSEALEVNEAVHLLTEQLLGLQKDLEEQRSAVRDLRSRFTEREAYWASKERSWEQEKAAWVAQKEELKNKMVDDLRNLEESLKKEIAASGAEIARRSTEDTSQLTETQRKTEDEISAINGKINTLESEIRKLQRHQERREQEFQDVAAKVGGLLDLQAKSAEDFERCSKAMEELQDVRDELRDVTKILGERVLSMENDLGRLEGMLEAEVVVERLSTEPKFIAAITSEIERRSEDFEKHWLDTIQKLVRAVEKKVTEIENGYRTRMDEIMANKGFAPVKQEHEDVKSTRSPSNPAMKRTGSATQQTGDKRQKMG